MSQEKVEYPLHFKKVGNALPKSTVTWSLGSFLPMTTRCPVSTKGLRQVSSARAHGRAYEAGPSLAWDVEEASTGKGQAQSSVPTFLGRRKYKKEGLSLSIHAHSQHFAVEGHFACKVYCIQISLQTKIIFREFLFLLGQLGGGTPI